MKDKLPEDIVFRAIMKVIKWSWKISHGKGGNNLKVDNDFEEKVADGIFDEEGNTLLCYPDPSEFDRILIEIDRKHGLDEYGEPIKKEIKTKKEVVYGISSKSNKWIC